MQGWIRDKRGSVITEFALILPVLLLIFGGIIDFGRAYWFKHTLTWASREGARQGAIMTPTNWNVTTVKNKVVQAVQNGCGLTISTSDVTVTPGTGPVPGANLDITVTVTVPFNFMLLPISLNNLSGSTIMRFETS